MSGRNRLILAAMMFLLRRRRRRRRRERQAVVLPTSPQFWVRDIFEKREELCNSFPYQSIHGLVFEIF